MKLTTEAQWNFAKHTPRLLARQLDAVGQLQARMAGNDARHLTSDALLRAAFTCTRLRVLITYLGTGGSIDAAYLDEELRRTGLELDCISWYMEGKPCGQEECEAAACLNRTTKIAANAIDAMKKGLVE